MLRYHVIFAALLVVLAPAPRASAADAHGLYVYGHSYTVGYGLHHPANRYTALVSREEKVRLHSRGVNGSQVHETEERLYGTGAQSWVAGTTGDVLIQANLNTARDHGTDIRALATSRNSLRVMLATVEASRRVEDTDRSYRYHGNWRLRRASWVSGGSMHDASTNSSYVQFTAIGGEFVSLRGVAGRGIRLRVSDRTAGRTFAHLNTGRRVHPAYSHDGIPLLYRLPRTLAGHTVRITKQSGRGTFRFDGRLPQRRDPGQVLLVEEPHLADYSLSTQHPNGSDRSIDAFNHVVDDVARGFPNTATVDLNGTGWNAQRYLNVDGVHPNRAGHRFIADAVEKMYHPH